MIISIKGVHTSLKFLDRFYNLDSIISNYFRFHRRQGMVKSGYTFGYPSEGVSILIINYMTK